MKDPKMEKLFELEALKAKIWPIFDILKDENVPVEDYFVVLFFLSAYKDGFIASNIEIGTYSRDKDFILHITDDKLLQQQYFPIFAYFAEYIDNFPDISKIKIHQILVSLDKKILKENFSGLFDIILYRITQSQGRTGAEFIQPVELTRFICGLAELEPNSRVYNPFAGLASFGVYLDQGHHYFGQELNEKTWALGGLRILAYQRPGDYKYVLDDSILHWPDENQKFDFIVSNPPYGLRLDSNYREVYPEYKTAEQFLIEKGVSSLTSTGKLIAILPTGFLFRGGSEHQLRKHLVESDLIESIIALPGGLLLNTGIPLVILVINKAKRMPGVVNFIDAKNFVELKSSGEKQLNDYALLSALRSDHVSDFVRTATMNQIKELGYILSVPRYFIKDFNGVRLVDIMEHVSGRRIAGNERGKLIRIRDLNDDKFNYLLDANGIDETEFSRPDIRIIEDSVLLLAVRWRTLKPTYFIYQNTPIFIPNDIIAFKVDHSKVNIGYLVNELHGEDVQEQLESYRMGDTIPFLRKVDLLNIKIRLPSINEQVAKVQGLQELGSELKLLLLSKNSLARVFGKKQFNEFASLKHTLGTPRQNILSYAEALISFFDKNQSPESKKVNADFKLQMGVDLNMVFLAIKHDINFISELLEKGENGLQLSEYNLELISLLDLEKIVAKLKSEAYNYTLRIQLLNNDNKGKQGLICNVTLLKILLDNILVNAHRHGFDDKNPSNEVVIDISLVDDNLVIDIKNNGKKFPNGFNKEKFITKYSTANPNTGTGIGGYDINRIIEYFNGTWDLILNEDTIYPVRFRIQFPIKPIL